MESDFVVLSLSLSLSISSVSLNILDPFQKMISCLLLTHWSLTYQLFNLSLTNDLQLISCLLLIICYFWSHVFIHCVDLLCLFYPLCLSTTIQEFLNPDLVCHALVVFTHNYTKHPSPYSLQTQVLIVVAVGTLHDYIRQEVQKDWLFEKYSNTDKILIDSNDEKRMKSYAGWSRHTSSVRWTNSKTISLL